MSAPSQRCSSGLPQSTLLRALAQVLALSMTAARSDGCSLLIRQAKPAVVDYSDFASSHDLVSLAFKSHAFWKKPLALTLSIVVPWPFMNAAPAPMQPI